MQRCHAVKSSEYRRGSYIVAGVVAIKYTDFNVVSRAYRPQLVDGCVLDKYRAISCIFSKTR